ncbi:MAG: hypothetical protein EZS28_008048, partial [Streblomastix strix]
MDKGGETLSRTYQSVGYQQDPPEPVYGFDYGKDT